MKASFHELDVVRLKQNIPSEGLCNGDLGTIHEVAEGDPPRYLVEFSNGKITLLVLQEDELELVWSFRNSKSGPSP